jgi:hypothetical protein
MALAGPKALNFCTGQLRAGRGDAPRVAVSASTDECAAATPRRGPTDGVMYCVSNKCVSGSKDTRAVCPYSVCVPFAWAHGWRERRLSARRPRQGEATDGVMCCVLNKCVSGSKDTRAVCPYRRLCAVRRCSRSRNHAREALAWGSLWLAGGKKIGKRGAYLLYNVWWV